MDGIFDKYQMIDRIVMNLSAISVSGMENVLRLANVFQMISTVKKGLKDEDNARNQVIESLKEQLKRATTPEPEDGGDVVGGEHYEFHFGGDGDAH